MSAEDCANFAKSTQKYVVPTIAATSISCLSIKAWTLRPSTYRDMRPWHSFLGFALRGLASETALTGIAANGTI